MKRISTFLLLIILSVTLAGCAPSATLDVSLPPWIDDNVRYYEQASYTITRTDSMGNEIASGTLIYTIDAVDSYYKLDTDFQLLYASGERDTITSTVYFSQFRLRPVRLLRSMRLESTVDYGLYHVGPESNYDIEANYLDCEIEGNSYVQGASGTFGVGTADQYTKSMSMSEKGFGSVDSEYVYYFVRAIDGLTEGYSINFNLYDVYSGLNLTSPALIRTPMAISVASTAVDYEINPDLVTPSGGIDKFAGVENSVSALKTTLRINDSRQGASTTLYYSKPVGETSIALNNRKVLLAMEIPEQTPDTGALLFTNKYVLNAYTR